MGLPNLAELVFYTGIYCVFLLGQKNHEMIKRYIRY